MLSRIVETSKELTRRAVATILRNEARVGRWAAQILPGERIRWHQSRLAGSAAKLEKRFLHVSAALEDLSGKSTELLESSRRLVKCSLGQEGGASIFQSAVAVMERPLNFNDECLEITNKVDGNLGLVAGRIGRLHRFKSTLEASIAPLRILQTMFRIESAASPPEVLALFVSLSAEIERLLGQISTMIAKEFEAIENTGATVIDVTARLREIHTRQIRAQKRREEIRASLTRLEEQLETDKLREVRLIGATQAVSDKIAGMVSALQYQDILNQRLEHVTRGLGGIADRSRALQTNRAPDALYFLRDASRVESAQLEDVEGVFGGAVETLRRALDSLADEMGNLGTECLLLNGVESPSAAVDGMVQVLLDTIQENLELIESTSARSREICQVLEPIGGLLGNLTGSILELSARIRLIALNAQIQAAQAGEGTGLEVLAGKTRSIAEEMAGIVKEITGELAALKQGLNDGLEDIEYTHRRSQEFLQFLLKDGRDQEILLHRFRDGMLAELQCAGDLIARVQAESRSLSSSLDMRSTVLEVVSCARRELQQFAERLTARLGRATHRSRLEQRALLYTAASERSAHERALSGDSMASLPFNPVSAMPAAALVEGSVELF